MTRPKKKRIEVREKRKWRGAKQASNGRTELTQEQRELLMSVPNKTNKKAPSPKGNHYLARSVMSISFMVSPAPATEPNYSLGDNSQPIEYKIPTIAQLPLEHYATVHHSRVRKPYEISEIFSNTLSLFGEDYWLPLNPKAVHPEIRGETGHFIKEGESALFRLTEDFIHFSKVEYEHDFILTESGKFFRKEEDGNFLYLCSNFLHTKE